MNHPDLKRRSDETALDYKYRICRDKDLLGLHTWHDVAELLNKEFDQNWSESTYRKWFTYFDAGVQYGKEKFTTDEYLQMLESKTIQFQKEKIKFQDQKREFSNLIRQQARFEHLKEEIHKSILELEKKKPLIVPDPVTVKGTARANVLWSDWHLGSDFKNSINEFNLDIFYNRLEKLVSRTIHYCIKHNVNYLTIGALGDFISGLIHVSTRVQSSEDVIKQLKLVAESMAEALSKISKFVETIRIIIVEGNHARLIPDKTQAILNENFEHLIPWYLQARLKEFSNIRIIESTDGYYIDNEFNNYHVYVHGDLDHVSSVAKSLPQFLGIVPKYIFCGHIHIDSVKEFGRSKVISNGSLMGPDDYAISKRLFSEPMQRMHIFDDDQRIEYHIPIYLD